MVKKIFYMQRVDDAKTISEFIKIAYQGKPLIHRKIEPVFVEALFNKDGKTIAQYAKEVGITEKQFIILFESACEYLTKIALSIPNIIEEAKQRSLVMIDISSLLQIKIEDILDEELGFHATRIKNICVKADIKSLGDLIKFSKDDLLKYQGCGAITVREISSFLEKNGLILRWD
ncbi:MAG: DUF1062 domain-containing protein [Candidatus Falkowbacteria bacterium]